METIADHKSLIDALGGNAEVARAGQWPAVRVGQWKAQNRIPVEYWPQIIAIAENRQVAGIDNDWLVARWRPRADLSEQSTAA
jgi:hypothetical protein